MTIDIDPFPEHEVLFTGRAASGRSPLALEAVGRVLLAVAGDGDDWRVLRDHLAIDECRAVDLLEVSHLDPGGSAESLLPPLDGVEAAIVVLGSDLGPTPGPAADEPRVAAITHLIGLLHGRLGVGRVLVLVEWGRAGVLAGTGVAEAPYRQGRIDDQFPRVRALLSETDDLDPPSAGLLSRFGVTNAALAPELWLVLGPLLVLGAVLAVIGLGLLSWRSAGPPPTRQISIDPATLAGGSPAGGTARTGAGVPVATGPGVGALPARCVVELGPSAALPAVIGCDGAGRLMADGYLGPWRNEVSSISLDAGVIGQAQLGLRPGQADPGRVELQPGADQSLANYRAGAGIERIELTFAAYGQRVVLHQDRARGGRQVSLTFTGS